MAVSYTHLDVYKRQAAGRPYYFERNTFIVKLGKFNYQTI